MFVGCGGGGFVLPAFVFAFFWRKTKCFFPRKAVVFKLFSGDELVLCLSGLVWVVFSGAFPLVWAVCSVVFGC